MTPAQIHHLISDLRKTVATWRKEMVEHGFLTPALRIAMDFLSEEAGEVAGAKPRQDPRYYRRNQKPGHEMKELMDWLLMALTSLEVGVFYPVENDHAGAGSDTKYRESVKNLIDNDSDIPLSTVLMLATGQANIALHSGADWKFWIDFGIQRLLNDITNQGYDAKSLLLDSLRERQRNVIMNRQAPPEGEAVVVTPQGHSLWRGCQVAFIPDEAEGDPDSELSEWGFVTSIRVEREITVFVRFWSMPTYWKSKTFSLRTVTNSEACYPNHIIPFVSALQDVVDEAMKKIAQGG